MKSIKDFIIKESKTQIQWVEDMLVIVNEGGSLTANVGGDGMYPRDLSENDLYLAFIYIAEDKRNKSFGSELMKLLLAEADKKNLNIVVWAEPIHSEESKEKLIAFYKKFGFVTDEEVSDNDGSCMIRQAK